MELRFGKRDLSIEGRKSRREYAKLLTQFFVALEQILQIEYKSSHMDGFQVDRLQDDVRLTMLLRRFTNNVG